MNKIIFSCIFFSVCFSIKAQESNDIRLSALPYYSYGKGLGITSPDSLFQLNIRFRMQNRLTYLNNEDEDPAYEALIRRLRLRFDGYVGDPKIIYVIQLSFSPNDVGTIEDGENLNVIRDAIVFYRQNFPETDNASILPVHCNLPTDRLTMRDSTSIVILGCKSII